MSLRTLYIMNLEVHLCCHNCRISFFLKDSIGQELVAFIYNPSYSGGRDEEDHGLKPVWANSLQDPILKKPFTYTHTKRAGGLAQSEGPELKPQ
jgi:hypothetical protein